MPLSLNTIKASKGSSKKRMRVGRGNSSGKGTYSGRGLKGQKARSGASGLKRLGMRQVLLRTPKLRGFKSPKPKNKIISLSDINKNFKENDAVSPKTLLEKRLTADIKAAVKILGNGKLELKGLKFSGIKMSASAKENIEELGGKVE